jgi:hypothetical protein
MSPRELDPSLGLAQGRWTLSLVMSKIVGFVYRSCVKEPSMLIG